MRPRRRYHVGTQYLRPRARCFACRFDLSDGFDCVPYSVSCHLLIKSSESRKTSRLFWDFFEKICFFVRLLL